MTTKPLVEHERPETSPNAAETIYKHWLTYIDKAQKMTYELNRITDEKERDIMYKRLRSQYRMINHMHTNF